MDAYGLSREEIEQVMKSGMKWKEENSEKWHARMGGTECVFIKQDNTLFVVTVYLSGGKK